MLRVQGGFRGLRFGGRGGGLSGFPCQFGGGQEP